MTVLPDDCMTRNTWKENILILLAVAAAIAWMPGRPLGDPAYSRLSTVHTLTEYGTWSLDSISQEDPLPFSTVDRVMVGGRVVDGVTLDGYIISSKPPLLPLAMTALYQLQKPFAGWDLRNEQDVIPVARFMTILLMTASYGIALFFFAKILVVLEIRIAVRLVLIASLAFGSQLFGFATIINNHVPGTAMLLIAIYHAIALGRGAVDPSAWRFSAFGIAGALACTIDMPAGVFVAMAGLYLLVLHPRRTLIWVLPAAALPLALHFGIMIAVTDSPLPVQTREAAYYYQGSYWRHPVGIDALNEPKSIYGFHMTFGRKGLFSLYPIMLAGIAAVGWALTQRNVSNRGFLLGGLAGFLILSGYYCFTTNNYGGESYGFRWYIPTMPVLLLMAAPLLDQTRSIWRWGFISAMVAVSVYSAFECARTDWQASQEWTCRILGPSV